MNRTARLLLATAFVLASGCAKQDWTDRTLVTEDVTGTWSGSAGGVGGGSREILLVLGQQGSTVRGSVQLGSDGYASVPVGADPLGLTIPPSLLARPGEVIQ